MALSGLAVFKLLPKTNCKECGFPTCMAFAMQLAASKAELAACPYVSDDAKAALGEAAAPAVRRVTIGTGGTAVVLGEETVLFRHEKRFEHLPGFALLLDESLDDSTFAARLAVFGAMAFDRVGQELKPSLVAVSAADAAVLKARAAQAAAATDRALMLMCEDAAALRAAAVPLKGRRPLLYAATEANWEAMADLAKELSLPLAVRAEGLEAVAALAERVCEAGVAEIVLDPDSADLRRALADQVFARRAAVKQRVRPVGFPTMSFPCRLASDPALQATFAAVMLCRYAGIVVLDTIDPAHWLPLLVLGQNIYTDPQRPMMVDEGIYPIGDPGPESPVLITTNFSLTYFTVSGEVEAGKIPAWLLVMNVEGQSVLTAWAAGKFVPEAIAPFIKRSGIEGKVSHRRLIIPGYVAQISGELAEELGEWDVIVGVREAADIPRFLRACGDAA